MAFRLAATTAEGSLLLVRQFQESAIVSRKPMEWAQKFSNRNNFDLGIEVAISTLSGTWSDVDQVRDERIVLGSLLSQSRLMKT